MAIEDGEQVTLLHWGNAFVDKVTKDAETGSVTHMVGRLNTAGNVKDTKNKVHWVPKLDDQVTHVVLREFDYLVTKAKIEDGDQIEDIINHHTIFETSAYGDPLLKTLKKGERIQLERRGFFIVDEQALPPRKTMVMIKIPDGKGKDVMLKSKVSAAKLQGSEHPKDNSKQQEAKQQKMDAKGEQKTEENKKQEAESKGEQEGKKSGKAKAKAAPKPADRPVEDITRLDIRVGKIQKVWAHPEADKLWCEEIDLGEDAVRTIASGLRAHVTEEQMLGATVVVLANLKPRTMKGFESQGMVLCATGSDGKVELLRPPVDAKIGERVSIEGVEMLEADARLNEKSGKAPLVAVSPGMRTTADRKAAYKGAVWQTSAGPVICENVMDGQIS